MTNRFYFCRISAYTVKVLWGWDDTVVWPYTLLLPVDSQLSTTHHFTGKLLRPRERDRWHLIWQKPEIAGTQVGAGCIPFPRCGLGPAWI